MCLLRNVFLYSLLPLLLLLASAPAAAEEPVKRTILALYNGSEESPDYSRTRIHLYAEFVLNYYGYVVKPCDVTGPLPGMDELDDCAAVFSWFNSAAMPNATGYLHWLEKVLDRNIKVIIWGHLGALNESRTGRLVSLPLVNRVLNRLGIHFYNYYNGNPLYINVTRLDRQMLEFERPFDKSRLTYEKMVSTDPQNTVHLSLELAHQPGSRSDMLVIGPHGAVVWGNTILYDQPYPDKSEDILLLRWWLDPFRFFSRVLPADQTPAMDVCARNGRRILYSHIDGDGLINISRLEQNVYSGRVVLEQILKKYRVPVSASFITSEIDPRYSGSAQSLALAREIASQPNVEPASHTFSHPFVWSEAQQQRFEGKYKEGYALGIQGYVFNLKDELEGSVRYINQKVAPAGKTCRCVFWSGNCLPEADALHLCAVNGYGNINGGTPRLDRKYNSYAYLAPLARTVGAWRQVYTTNCNDFLYTNFWSGPFQGMEQVLQTWENTERGRLYRPMNIYYHYYSGERLASLNALKKLYEYALARPVFPVFTSRYIDIVNGFFSARIHRLGAQRWQFSHYGECRTVRFPTAALVPDLAACVNVLGYTVIKEQLYVALGPAAAAVVALAAPGRPPGRPWLISSNMDLTAFTTGPGRVVLAGTGWPTPVCALGGFAPDQKVRVHRSVADDKTTFPVTADRQGVVTVHCADALPGAVVRLELDARN